MGARTIIWQPFGFPLDFSPFVYHRVTEIGLINRPLQTASDIM